ncbi:unnamed protein product, partial [Ixodes pacificus]
VSATGLYNDARTYSAQYRTRQRTLDETTTCRWENKKLSVVSSDPYIDISNPEPYEFPIVVSTGCCCVEHPGHREVCQPGRRRAATEGFDFERRTCRLGLRQWPCRTRRRQKRVPQLHVGAPQSNLQATGRRRH